MRRSSRARADAFLWAMRERSNKIRRPMARERVRGRGERARSRGGARTVVRSGVSSARIFHSARRQARLPPASGAARQRRAQSPRARFDLGYLLAPMNRGIRLTTGVEFARRDAPSNPIQIEQALPRAHALFPLGEAIDAKPWKGARPCLPDMLPVIGQGATPCRAVVRFRTPAPWADAGSRDRPAAGGNDDRRDAFRRSRRPLPPRALVDHGAERRCQGAFPSGRLRPVASRGDTAATLSRQCRSAHEGKR